MLGGMTTSPISRNMRRRAPWAVTMALAVAGAVTFAVGLWNVNAGVGALTVVGWIVAFALGILNVMDATSRSFRLGTAIALCGLCLLGASFGGIYLFPAALMFLVLAIGGDIPRSAPR